MGAFLASLIKQARQGTLTARKAKERLLDARLRALELEYQDTERVLDRAEAQFKATQCMYDSRTPEMRNFLGKYGVQLPEARIRVRQTDARRHREQAKSLEPAVTPPSTDHLTLLRKEHSVKVVNRWARAADVQARLRALDRRGAGLCARRERVLASMDLLLNRTEPESLALFECMAERGLLVRWVYHYDFGLGAEPATSKPTHKGHKKLEPRPASARSRPGIMGWEEIVLLGFLRHTQLELTGMLDFLRARHLPPPPPRPDQLHRLARDAAECAHNLLEYEPEPLHQPYMSAYVQLKPEYDVLREWLKEQGLLRDYQRHWQAHPVLYPVQEPTNRPE